MARDTDSTVRAKRAGTSRTMRGYTRTCKGCGRGQNPRVVTFPGGSVWQCRYCGHEHAQTGESAPERQTDAPAQREGRDA